MARITRAIIALLLLGLWLWPAPAQAQAGSAWQIDFFPNTSWAGAPAFTSFANVINFNWGTSAPGPRMPSSNWTARMTTSTFLYAGTYRVTIVADDEFSLSADGITRFSTLGQPQPGKAFVIDLTVTQGTHNVQIDFRQFSGTAYITMEWAYLKDVIVTPALPPATAPVPSATSVVTQYGDYTPCIQQNIHQSNCFQSTGAWDSPNLGSIEMEPQIVVWGNCTADTVQTMQLFINTAPQSAACSRTEAGWFPR
jgi:hypothetical protein